MWDKTVIIRYMHIILSIDPGLRVVEILSTSKYHNLSLIIF